MKQKEDIKNILLKIRKTVMKNIAEEISAVLSWRSSLQRTINLFLLMLLSMGGIAVIAIGSASEAAAGHYIWIANSGSGTVSKIDTDADTVVATISVGSYPFAVAVSGTHVFVANRDSKSISVINKYTDIVEADIELDRYPLALSLGSGDYLHVIVTRNTIGYTGSNTAYLYKIDIGTLSKVQELQLKNISNLDIGIGVNSNNIAYIPYEYSWIGISGCMIVNLNSYRITGDYKHHKSTYGYLGPGVTVDDDGNGWLTGIRSSEQSSIIKITPSGARTYYKGDRIGSRHDLVIDMDGFVWSASYNTALTRINPSDGSIKTYNLPDWSNSPYPPHGLSFINGYLWLTDPNKNLIRKINPADGTEVARIAVGDQPYSIGDLSGYEAMRVGLIDSIAEITFLEVETPFLSEFSELETSHYYGVFPQQIGFTRVTLDDIDDVGENKLYAKCGSLPNRVRYDFSSVGAGSTDQELIIYTEEATTCYISAYSETNSGEYSITASPMEFGVSSTTPSYYGNSQEAEITIFGAGFGEGVVVVLLDSNGNEYQALSITVDSLFQIATEFNLADVPVGKYSIKVTQGDHESTLSDGFEVFETQKAELETNLVLPGKLGRHATATIYVEYKNNGNVAMPAPLLMLVSSDADDSDKPILTLDSSKVVQNFWATGMPSGSGHSVQILADGDGESPGVLQPGESGRVPVYYIGLLQPWDFSDRMVELEIRIVAGDEPTSFYWEERKEGMKPDSLDQAAWDVIFENLSTGVGETWGDYISTLAENSAYLYRHSRKRVSDTGKLMQFEMLQAVGYSPVTVLAAQSDITVESSGMDLMFARYYANSITKRYVSGSLGKGWVHNWQLSIQEEESGDVSFRYMNSRISYTLDSRGGYFSPAGNYTKLNKSGAVFTITTPGGPRIVFNSNGSLDYIEDLNNNRITAEYSGELLTRLVHSGGQYLALDYDGFGLLSSITDNSGDLAANYFYQDDKLTAAEDILGRFTEYSYHQSGKATQALATTVMPDETVNFYNYDDNGRLSEMSFNGNPSVTIEYDTLGTVTISNTANQAMYRYYYDDQGQFVKYQDPFNQTTLARYDNQFNLTALMQPDGATTSLSYDRNGNLINVLDQLQQRTGFGYGDNNRLTSFTDSENSTTAYLYDAEGNNTARVSPDLSEQRYINDSTGEIIQRDNRRGTPIRLTRDSSGRVIRRDYNDGSFVEYDYNIVGNLISVVDSTGTTTMEYYGNHLLRRITYPGNRFLEYSYDSAGRRSSLVDQTGYQLNYTYTADGRLGSVSDGAGDSLAQYSYNASGRLAAGTLGNGVSTTYQYDLAGRVTNLTTTAADGAEISSYTYEYDVNGRRTTATSRDGVWDYTYDATGQLTFAWFSSSNPEIPSKAMEYVYDKAGNRIREIVNSQSIEYSVNNMNQYSRAGAFSYSYDEDGNLTSKTDGLNSWIYEYNDNNRLVRSTGSGETKEYMYNGLGYLATVVEDGVERHFTIDPVGLGNVVGEYAGSGELINRYNHGFGLVSTNNNYFTFDGNGNTSEITGTANEILNFYVYEPFGQSLYEVETVDNDFEFVGQFGLREMGDDLVYMRNRFYAPSTGRFMNEDPIGLAGGDVSFYRYVSNDPVNWVDPWGLSKDEVIVKGSNKFVMHPGDNAHGGKHWHVHQRKGGKLLGRVALDGKVLTGSVSKTALKYLASIGKIGGGAVGLILSLALPGEAAAPEAYSYDDPFSDWDQDGNGIPDLIEPLPDDGC